MILVRERAGWRFLEFFTVHIRDPHTHAAYTHAAKLFLNWCETRGTSELLTIEPMHVAGYFEQLQKERSAPTVKQHLACLRMLFDWLVTGQIVPSNLAHSVREPRHSVSKGSTRIISSAEARNRALVAPMPFTFACVPAVVDFKVEDYYPQKKRWCFGCARSAAKPTRCPATTSLRPTLTRISQLLASARTRRAGSFGRRSGEASGSPNRQSLAPMSGTRLDASEWRSI